jgi:hypothetical protein
MSKTTRVHYDRASGALLRTVTKSAGSRLDLRPRALPNEEVAVAPEAVALEAPRPPRAPRIRVGRRPPGAEVLAKRARLKQRLEGGGATPIAELRRCVQFLIDQGLLDELPEGK